MKQQKKGSVKEIMRTVEAGEYSVQAMQMMDESKWIIDIMIDSYADMLPEEDIKSLKETQGMLKELIHSVSMASENIFARLEDVLSKPLVKTSYRTARMPKELVKYENKDKLLITFPEGCLCEGYSTWLSRKFVHESPDNEEYQVNFYPGWKMSVYKYERSAEGKMVPVNKREIDTDTFENDLKTSSSLYRQMDLSFVEPVQYGV